jgi:RHS repeat-associated protein
MNKTIGHYRKVYGTSENLEFFYNDNLDSRRVIINSSGTKLDTFEYSSWGNVTHSYGSNNYLSSFTGKNYDGTGFIYFNARYYDPTTGRFLTEDPSRQGVNWYAYCENDPINKIDPDGNGPLLSEVKHAINAVADFMGLNQVGWPVSEGRVTSAYGVRTDATPSRHWGIDIAPRVPGSTGVRVNAPAGGDVVSVGRSSGGSSEVVIRLPNGQLVDMKHLTGIAVKPGDTVLRGERLGTMGSDGPSTGIHAHMEIRPAGAVSERQAVDPVPLMAPRPAAIRLTDAVVQQGNTIVNQTR